MNHCILLFLLALSACGDKEAGTETGDGSADGSDGSISSCADGDNRLTATLDGTVAEACDATFHAGELNHVIGLLDDGHTLVVNFNGQEPAEGACVSLTMRVPGSDGSTNDWSSSACDVTVTAYGDRVTGSFSGTMEPETDASLGTVEITGGSFDVAMP